MAKKALGKGLGAIISTSATPVEDMEKGLTDDLERIVEIDIESISPNPDQPRTHFDEIGIEELAESIKSIGLIQPIIVRKADEGYYIVAGERRYRAVKYLNQTTIKSIIIEADEEQNFSVALIENIQRVDLDPIEEAKAYKILISRFKLKQQELASRVGKDRATISNMLRLLNLPEQVQEALSANKISTGHAKVLLSVQETDDIMKFFRAIIDNELSVRALENLINEQKKEEAEDKQQDEKQKSPHIKKMEDKLVSLLGTKVEIKHNGNRGRIEISYYSLDDFERIVEMIK